jgi:hypothetical protein
MIKGKYCSQQPVKVLVDYRALIRDLQSALDRALWFRIFAPLWC